MKADCLRRVAGTGVEPDVFGAWTRCVIRFTLPPERRAAVRGSSTLLDALKTFRQRREVNSGLELTAHFVFPAWQHSQHWLLATKPYRGFWHLLTAHANRVKGCMYVHENTHTQQMNTETVSRCSIPWDSFDTIPRRGKTNMTDVTFCQLWGQSGATLRPNHKRLASQGVCAYASGDRSFWVADNLSPSLPGVQILTVCCRSSSGSLPWILSSNTRHDIFQDWLLHLR